MEAKTRPSTITRSEQRVIVAQRSVIGPPAAPERAVPAELDFPRTIHLVKARPPISQKRLAMKSTDAIADSRPVPNAEAWLLLAYFALYLAYLCWRLEGEMLHWIGLVAAPLGVIILFRQLRGESNALAGISRDTGLAPPNRSRGVLIAILLGILLSGVQILSTKTRASIFAHAEDGSIYYLLPLSFVVMFFTAAFTEEFFFRGVLQARLETLTKSRFWGVVLASVAFSLYHVPYAYFHPKWPSHGDLGAAFQLSFGQALPAGLILGTLFTRTKWNLLPCVIVHAMINMLPAMNSVSGLIPKP